MKLRVRWVRSQAAPKWAPGRTPQAAGKSLGGAPACGGAIPFGDGLAAGLGAKLAGPDVERATIARHN